MNSIWFKLFLLVGLVLVYQKACTDDPLETQEEYLDDDFAADQEGQHIENDIELEPTQPKRPSKSKPKPKPQPNKNVDKVVPKNEPKSVEEAKPEWPPGRNDSRVSLSELRELYAKPDLRETLKLAEDGTGKWEGPIDVYVKGAGTFQKGSQSIEYRRHVSTGPDQAGASEESCVSVKERGKRPVVGVFGKGTLKIKVLPHNYAHLYEIADTYYILILVEYRDANPDRDAVFKRDHILYKKQTDGRVTKLTARVLRSIPDQYNDFSSIPYCTKTFNEERREF